MINKNNEISALEEIFEDYKDSYYPIISDFTKIYTYDIDSKIVGFVVFNIMYEKCEIIDIYVKKDYRRNNVAKKLMSEIEKDFDLENITLEVSTDNIAAIKLYKKLGFKNISIRKKYYKNTDAILMLKEVR